MLSFDGLQRIFSYLHFRACLDAKHLDPPVAKGEALRLVDCDIINELNGLSFAQLPASLQIRLKRAFIRVEVVKKGTDSHFKYHMFKRLNTGGEGLSDQQVRNCAIRLLSSRFPDFLISMSKVESFATCTEALTQNRVLEAMDQELVLRFFALRNNAAGFKHGIDDFLTEYMEGVADPEKPVQFDYLKEEAAFKKTFELLKRSLAEKAFAFRNRSGTQLASGFSVYHFEAITIGLQSVMDKLNPDDEQAVEKLKETLTAIKLDSDFAKMTTGGGKNSSGLLKTRIEFVERRLRDAFP